MERFSLFDGEKYIKIESPICVFFDITNRCNLNCFYCFSNDNIMRKDKNLKPLTVEQIKDILLDLAQSDVKLVEFSGGEPLVVKEFINIVKYAKSLGLMVSFVSNGTLFTDEICRELKGLLNFVNITLRGYNEESHDKVTGIKGSYRKTLNSIKLLNKYEIGVGVLLDPTYLNHKHIGDYIANLFLKEKIHLKSLFMNRINVRNKENQGEAKDEFCLRSVSEYEMVFEQLEYLNKEFGLFVELEAFPLCEVNPKYHKLLTRCNYGLTHAGIDFEGNLKMCPVSSQTLGNLLHNSIKELWSNSPIAKEFRSLKWVDAKCKSCSSFESCGSGCWNSQPETLTYQRDYFFRKIRFEDTFIPQFKADIILKQNDGSHILLFQRKVPRPLPVKAFYGERDILKLSDFEKQIVELIDGRRNIGDIKCELKESGRTTDVIKDEVDKLIIELTNYSII